MHGYPVMQVVQYSVPPSCSWGPPLDTQRSSTVSNPIHGVKKYIIWCLICGGTSSLIGVMFLGVYFLLRSYTSSVAYFETVPTFVPATLLMLTGLCIVSLARRRNRYSYLIKLSGTCGVASALTCALVTVTTTVLHLSRLQTLRQCEYTQKTRTCTCYTVVLDTHTEAIINDEARFVFDSTADCGIVHGALYSCLRAIFGLSVAGVLVAVFSCMLVYQLLSHERKKVYWEQLELRCRSMYPDQPPLPPHGVSSIVGNQRTCRCCHQYYTPRNVGPHTDYSWESYNRYWQPGHENSIHPPRREDLERNPNQVYPANQRDRDIGWSWPRMPWQRNNIQRFAQTPSSPDSQYGFSNHQQFLQDSLVMPHTQSNYSIDRVIPYSVWGPPPPYSDPNSPSRRGRYQYVHPHQFQQTLEEPTQCVSINKNITENRQASPNRQSMEPLSYQSNDHFQQTCSRRPPITTVKNNEQLENQFVNEYRFREEYSNTIPSRKPKRRIDVGVKSIGSNQQTHRVNVQNINFNNNPNSKSKSDKRNYQENNNSVNLNIRRVKANIENDNYHNHSSETGKFVDCGDQNLYYSNCQNNNNNNLNIMNNGNGDEGFQNYLAPKYGKIETDFQNYHPFNQKPASKHYEKITDIDLDDIPRISSMRKDISQQSMFSVESERKTDVTDLSPVTPLSNTPSNKEISFLNDSVKLKYNKSSTPAYLTNRISDDDEYHGKTNIHENASEYNSISLNNDLGNRYADYNHFHHNNNKIKNLNITPIKRQCLGTNISTIIQNISDGNNVDDAELLCSKNDSNDIYLINKKNNNIVNIGNNNNNINVQNDNNNNNSNNSNK